MTYKQPEFIAMFDIESLDTGPRSVVSQIAYSIARADDPETIVDQRLVYLPIQPQVVLKRTISASTILFWMKQSDEARARFAENTGEEFEELPALLRHIMRGYANTVLDKETEVWARGPQFDIVNIESLAQDCAVDVPWGYSKVRDLRTLMAMAGIATADVPREPRLKEHMADHDTEYQLQCYVEAMRRLRSRT